MNVAGMIVIAFAAYTVGFVSCGMLTHGLVDDLRNLLAALLEHPNDASIRELVSDTLYQKSEG